MTTQKTDSVELLLSKLDKNQLATFIMRECKDDGQFMDRFLALGAGTVFAPSPETYSSRIENLIDEFSGRYGYIEYRDTFDFNRAASRILDEVDKALHARKWKVVIAILTGIANSCETIINSGDDSAGELGAIVAECIEKWHEL